MKKSLAVAVLAVSALSLLASCSSGTSENLNSRPAMMHKNVIPDDQSILNPGNTQKDNSGNNANNQ